MRSEMDDAPEFVAEVLEPALKHMGEDACKASFAAGLPVVFIRGEALVALYGDGREEILGQADQDPAHSPS